MTSKKTNFAGDIAEVILESVGNVVVESLSFRKE